MYRRMMEKVSSGEEMTMQESRVVLDAMVDGEWEPLQIETFLLALKRKGETAGELAGFASAMCEKAVQVAVNGMETIDTCGTGGDRKDTFNISTAAAFVLAGCGVPVVKHGNGAASSSCGSADLLQALGINHRLRPEEAAASLYENHFAFLFAPDYHPALRTLVTIRRKLGVPTIFNLLGPLTNPARPIAQMIGVYDGTALPRMAQALSAMDSGKRALLVHSIDGHDEATPCSRFKMHTIGIELGMREAAAEDFGMEPCPPEELRGGSPARNAEIVMSILEGKRTPARTAVLLNAALGYRVFAPSTPWNGAVQAVEDSIETGAAREVVARLRKKYPLMESA